MCLICVELNIFYLKQQIIMSYEMALKKAGLPLIRCFIQSVEAVVPGLPATAQRNNNITFKLKTYRDGKPIKSDMVETVHEAFPAKGDSK